MGLGSRRTFSPRLANKTPSTAVTGKPSHTRKRPLPGAYSRPMPSVLRRSQGVGGGLMSEVSLWRDPSLWSNMYQGHGATLERDRDYYGHAACNPTNSCTRSASVATAPSTLFNPRDGPVGSQAGPCIPRRARPLCAKRTPVQGEEWRYFS